MTPFAIAGVQMHVAAVHENVSAMAHRIELTLARFPWVQMIVFSELATYGPVPSNHPELPDGTIETFAELAQRHNVWLLPGSMFERVDGHLYNTARVFSPTGAIAGTYRKMFPFLPYEAGVSSGNEFLVFDVPGAGRFGVSICYDIWFPETTRTLTAMGAEVLLHPVLTATIDRETELSIARANAAMFQCYVFDINGLGPGGTGRSCVVDPAGSILYQAAGQEEIIPVEVDFDVVRRQRAAGLRGLGQPLKSFRDTTARFEIYDREMSDHRYLDSLGPLEMPGQGSTAGLDARSPSEIMAPADSRVIDFTDEYPKRNQG